MKFSEILAFSVAFATATAAPAKRTDTVEITFHGAAGAQFTQSFPTDDTTTSIYNPLSISKISSNTNLVECSFTGVDGSFTTVDGAVSSDVGPPQTQVSGTCFKLPSQRRRSRDVAITFIGAAGAQFTQSFPIDDTVQTISNPLSISHISNSNDGVECYFTGVDNSYTVVDGAVEVDVGPPQTQVSGQCFELPTPARRSYGGAKVTFIGAAGAKFAQRFPLDGLTYDITNVLSISHIEVDEAGVSCTFDGVDNSVTSVTGPNTVDVGPPQTQVRGSCW
ncbi:uncharacterized protein N7484_008412 [Penicillium longicatenatum]|uniref:uncharacterized protein n=1 Tax=Penicillium longicatenatum TaxID=1561947 RepID=UPI002546C554|nr:uncharacterized protein N7484_008412 [Penicillium longicatenatum]KAJ5635099.1 hypothetical protein N7484_008412 [Penicillium longicatenatum]